MGSVHFGRLLGPAGFSRTVAVKRLHESMVQDPEFVAMMMDEARLAARIHHPNVVPTLDVVALEGELLVVMDYVAGESLSRLARAVERKGELIPQPFAVSILVGALHGLHAAHEATSEQGAPLGIVHRDVSPQNVMVGIDGVARVLDFGVAKAAGRVQTTRDGQLKGKLAYMPPEQLAGKEVDRRVDVYAAAVVLWEALAGRRLFVRDSEAATMHAILYDAVDRPSAFAPEVPPELDAIVLKGLARDPSARYESALALALALERVVHLPPAHEIGTWVRSTAKDELGRRAGALAEIESSSGVVEVGRAPQGRWPAEAQDVPTMGRAATPAGVTTEARARPAFAFQDTERAAPANAAPSKDGANRPAPSSPRAANARPTASSARTSTSEGPSVRVHSAGLRRPDEIAQSPRASSPQVNAREASAWRRVATSPLLAIALLILGYGGMARHEAAKVTAARAAVNAALRGVEALGERVATEMASTPTGSLAPFATACGNKLSRGAENSVMAYVAGPSPALRAALGPRASELPSREIVGASLGEVDWAIAEDKTTLTVLDLSLELLLHKPWKWRQHVRFRALRGPDAAALRYLVVSVTREASPPKPLDDSAFEGGTAVMHARIVDAGGTLVCEGLVRTRLSMGRGAADGAAEAQGEQQRYLAYGATTMASLKYEAQLRVAPLVPVCSAVGEMYCHAVEQLLR